MRKGTLSDAETLRLYEQGVAMIAICIHEGMTPYGVISRISRARRGRMFARGRIATVRARQRTPQPTYDTFNALRAAVRALERETAKLERQAA
jgi:hypothetical protein